jgi:hypothetical protein
MLYFININLLNEEREREEAVKLFYKLVNSKQQK